MPKRIFEFFLSEHFMLQGWKRGIDETCLKLILPYVEVSAAEKKLVVITPAFYSKRGIIGKSNHCLVLILHQKLIKTGFWCDHPNYLFKKDKNADFQLIYC